MNNFVLVIDDETLEALNIHNHGKDMSFNELLESFIRSNSTGSRFMPDTGYTVYKFSNKITVLLKEQLTPYLEWKNNYNFIYNSIFYALIPMLKQIPANEHFIQYVDQRTVNTVTELNIEI